MKTAILLAIIVLADSAGDVLLTRGMKQVGEVTTIALKPLLRILRKAARNRNVVMALFFMAIYFFGFLALLSWADLSLAFPATTLVYVVSTLGAKFILKETVTLERWVGILLVCLGVALTSLP
jgi:drug/metabolite transporter (DMT)-like permease